MAALSPIRIVERLVEEACQQETNRFGYGIWTHHIVYVVKYGKLLAQKLEADEEIVELGALLHDYAGIKSSASVENHHLEGALEAGRVLASLGYSEAKIAAVEHCIISHRGSVPLERRTLEAECLASADAMAHIDQAPSLFYLVYVRHGMGIDEGSTWVREKLERSWKKLCPEAQEMICAKYEAALRLLV